MKIFKFTCLILFLGLSACSPKIKTSINNASFKALTANETIVILNENEEAPEKSQFIGDLKIGDSGFTTDCGYSKVISDAKATARTSGANIIKLTQVKKPSAFGSTCYRIKAKLYRNTDNTILAAIAEKRALENKSTLSEDADYAMVYFYRPKSSQGFLIGYKIKKGNDDIIGRVRNGEKFSYRIEDFKNQEFFGETETRESISIDIEKGQEYFVRCSLKFGIAIGRPVLELVEPNIGRKEFMALEQKN